MTAAISRYWSTFGRLRWWRPSSDDLWNDPIGPDASCSQERREGPRPRIQLPGDRVAASSHVGDRLTTGGHWAPSAEVDAGTEAAGYRALLR